MARYRLAREPESAILAIPSSTYPVEIPMAAIGGDVAEDRHDFGVGASFELALKSGWTEGDLVAGPASATHFRSAERCQGMADKKERGAR
jgi:hypothetical protein